MTRPGTDAPARTLSVAACRAILGGALFGLGLVLWVLYRVLAGSEAHSYIPGNAQESVTLEHGRTYWLAVPGGVRHLRTEVGSGLHCRLISASGSAPLSLAKEDSSTKMVNAVASFISPVDGNTRVSCSGVFDAYVDNAAGDPSGWVLVLATILLTVGAPLLLSAGYAYWRGRPAPDYGSYRLTAPLS